MSLNSPAEETTRPILPPDEGIEPLSTSATDVPQRTDNAWAVVFKLNVAFTIGLVASSFIVGAFMAGSTFSVVRSLEHLRDAPRQASLVLHPLPTVVHARAVEAANRSAMYTGSIVLWPLMFAYAVGLIAWWFGRRVLCIMTSYSTDTLEVAFFSFAAMCGMMAVTALATGHWLAWIMPALLSGLTMLFFSKHRSRIAFSSANLKVAAIAIKATPWTIPTGVFFGSCQVWWVAHSAAAAWGSIASLHTATTPRGDVYRAAYCHNEISTYGDADHIICRCGNIFWFLSPCLMTERPISSIALACFWLASLTWTTTVIRNLVSVAVTSSVTSWWVSSAGDKRHVEVAVQRAYKGSFGSVCKAAAASTLARLPIMVMRRLSRIFPLKPLGEAADYIPAYSIYFIGIYGVDFSEASRRVSALVRRRGVTAIANDTLVDIGLAGLALTATALFMILVFAVLNVVSDQPFGMGGLSELFGKTVGVLSLSYLVAVVLATILDILRAGFKAVFVCFLQDPQALATNHGREIYEELSKAWREMQAECLEVDGDDEHQALRAMDAENLEGASNDRHRSIFRLLEDAAPTREGESAGVALLPRHAEGRESTREEERP